MLDAYKASFGFYVFASDMDDASEKVRAWRPLALAAGFDPGSASVKKASAREVRGLRDLDEALAGARARLMATERQRTNAIRGLAAHMGGDVEGAEEFIASIERTSGPLLGQVAIAFAELAA